jgi:hypothetical protein
MGSAGPIAVPARRRIPLAANPTRVASANSNTVVTLDDPFDGPAAEALRQKFNELVIALRR